MTNQLIHIQDNTGKQGSHPVSPAPHPPPSFDLAAARARLKQSKGQEYWRSLEELAQTEEFAAYLQKEFPRQAPRDMDPLSRRDFMKLMGAALALAGVGGCAFQPAEKIVPYVKQPEEMTPGVPLYYATAMQLGGSAIGLLAESHMGRPTKIEGNPDHPDSLGRADVWAQASILALYDPDRSQAVRKLGVGATWDSFIGELNTALDARRATRGAGLRVLTETVTSPTLAAQMADLQRAFPQMQWHQHEPVNRDNARAGAILAFGQDAHAAYRFDRADVILSLDADFLLTEPGHVRYAKEFIERRRVRSGTTRMNRLYVAESSPTITGLKADHRMPMRPSQVETFTRAVAAGVGVAGATGGEAITAGSPLGRKVAAIVKDLRANRGQGLVIAGAQQSPAVHALAHAINEALGNAGATVEYRAPMAANPVDQTDSLRDLVTDMNAGQVQTLVVLGGNPVYNAPADLKFLDAFKKVPLRVHLSMHDDETSAWAHWHVPEAHYLEAWSDLRASDGTASIVQPLIVPLYEATRSAHEVLAAMLGQGIQTSYDIVRGHYERTRGAATPGSATSVAMAGATAGGDRSQATGSSIAPPGRPATSQTMQTSQNAQAALAFDKYWQTIIHDGVVPGTALPVRALRVRPGFAASLPAPPKATTGLEIIFRPDPAVWDGRFANNAWLQELPKPLSKLTWDNAALMSPVTAQRLGVTSEDKVRLKLRGRTVEAAVLMLPGHPDDCVTAHLGYGRTRGGRIAADAGFNAYLLRPSDAPHFAAGLEVEKTGERYPLARTDYHNLIDDHSKWLARMSGSQSAHEEIDGTHGRDIVRAGTLAEFVQDPHFAVPLSHRATLPNIPTYTSPHDDPRQGYNNPPKDGAQPVPGGSAHGGGPNEAAATGGVTHKSAAANSHGTSAVGHGGDAKGGEIGGEEGEREEQPSLYPRDMDITKRYRDDSLNTPANPTARPYAWGMAIDLNACIGCNACVIGCQSENNVATVGKHQVLMNRQMQWLRIDTYYKGEIENPEGTFMPMLCQHCEKAPCEPVCPVNAAVHSPEGLNEQVYNRCIGTRYCSNNCPYKVRRFNYLQYSDQDTPVIQLMQNPDVTVRARGVMEKCNYCVQRINYAKFQAEKEDRQVKDGELVTACQQTCPTDAIVFGNINDPDSQVRKLKEEPHNYGVLTELNTFPRTTYLAKIGNPNPEVAAIEQAEKNDTNDTPNDNSREVANNG